MKIPKLQADGYANMLELFPEEPLESGNVSIQQFVLTQEDSKKTEWNALIRQDKSQFCPPGRYVSMTVNGRVMMSDTLMEKETNRRFVDNVYGRVLIAGLGLGMILHPILQNPKVEAVEVIENNQHVINLVLPTLACYESLLRVHWGDVRTPLAAAKFDCIYFDIWPIYGNHIIECPRLFDQYKPLLKESGMMTAWMLEEQIANVARDFGVEPEDISLALDRMYADGKDLEEGDV
jgi:hypothetical protein